MSTYGLTPVGFAAKPAPVIKAELEAAFKAGPLGSSAGTESDGSIPAQTIAGQIIGVMTDALAAQWEGQEALAASFDPNQATDEAQDALCSITGTVRDGAVSSSVTGTATGAPSTLLLAGRVATVATAGSRFVSQADKTIGAVAAWAATHGYIVGDRVTANGRVYHCTQAGTSAGSGTGPNTTGTGIVDNTVRWTYLGQGTAAVDVAFVAEQVGPVGALAGTLTGIATPVAGWQSVNNLLDAAVGRLQETNTALRIKREAELQAEGLAAADAIRAHVLKVGAGTVNAVTACTVFYNDTDATDGNGVPPHSVEVLALGGLDADVALAVWQAVGAGLHTHGTTTTVVTDSQGKAQTVRWSRPTAVPIYIVANVTYDQTAGAFPSDGATEIKGALKTFGDTYPIGKSVRAAPLEATVFDGPTSTQPGAGPVPGILDVTALYIGIAPAPGTSATIAITSRQLATFDTSRITVNLTGGTP